MHASDNRVTDVITRTQQWHADGEFFCELVLRNKHVLTVSSPISSSMALLAAREKVAELEGYLEEQCFFCGRHTTTMMHALTCIICATNIRPIDSIRRYVCGARPPEKSFQRRLGGNRAQ